MKKFLLKENYTSSNLLDKINLLTESQIAQIANGIAWTTENYHTAVLIGGTALVHYLKNSRDLTPDIDFLVYDIEQLRLILEDQDIPYQPLRSTDENIGLTVDDFNTDYLDSNTVNPTLNKLILSTYNMANIGGYSVRIINPELLTIMKLELGRDKDIKDGFALIQSGLLNKNKYLKYLEQLKTSLNDYESLKSYSEMLFNI